MDTVLDPL